MFWTWLWGPMGLIIATPLTVCLVVIGHHVPSLRLFPIMFGDKPVLAESARLYDRLLAALALAQADHAAGLLSDHQTLRIANAAWTLTDELETVIEEELTLAAEGPAPDADATTLVSNGVLDGLGRRIAVMGAVTRLDEAAAQMVAQALRAEGAEVLALPPRARLPRALGEFAPETLILVSLDAAHLGSVDLQIRNLRRRLPAVKLGLAQWTAVTQAEATAPRKGAADFAVTDSLRIWCHRGVAAIWFSSAAATAAPMSWLAVMPCANGMRCSR